MDTTTTGKQLSSPAADEADTALDHLLAFMSELTSVVEEENRVLARGIPASLSSFTERKNDLADKLEGWVKEANEQQLIFRAVQTPERDRFLETVGSLRGAMDENVDRLRVAIEATRRRIDTVMRAIRSEVAATSPYGANGRINETRSQPVLVGKGVQV